MASESSSPDDNADAADSPPWRPPHDVSAAQEIGGSINNVGDSPAAPPVREVHRDGTTASTSISLNDDDHHIKETEGLQLHDGPSGPHPFLPEADKSLAKRVENKVEGSQLHDGLTAPPCFSSEFEDSIARKVDQERAMSDQAASTAFEDRLRVSHQVKNNLSLTFAHRNSAA